MTVQAVYTDRKLIKDWEISGFKTHMTFTGYELAQSSITLSYGGLTMGISDEKMVDRYRFPVTHWIMMSLNSDYKTHVDEDVDFTMSFDTYDAKKQANIREIKARLENISTPYEACKMAYLFCEMKNGIGIIHSIICVNPADQPM